ncbi:hypothetical protein HQS1_51920 [Delftia lacustris]|nr:hypothetical protein HQS1_51920 [Delftia lacustris]
MVLHFYKYSGNIQLARIEGDLIKLRKNLIDSFIICMASANAMNLSLGEQISCNIEIDDFDKLATHLSQSISHENLFDASLHSILILGGRMAKAIESSDHMEKGDPRAAMEKLVPELARSILSVLGKFEGPIEVDIRARLRAIEQNSIFLRYSDR